MAVPGMLKQLNDELGNIFKGTHSKHLTMKKSADIAQPVEPMPLTEPDDMVIIVAPCHSYEPVKVPESASGPFHCLVCGDAFAV
jgi:hypothetical protein